MASGDDESCVAASECVSISACIVVGISGFHPVERKYQARWGAIRGWALRYACSWHGPNTYLRFMGGITV